MNASIRTSYLIPKGYVGWIRLIFTVKAATPLPRLRSQKEISHVHTHAPHDPSDRNRNDKHPIWKTNTTNPDGGPATNQEAKNSRMGKRTHKDSRCYQQAWNGNPSWQGPLG